MTPCAAAVVCRRRHWPAVISTEGGEAIDIADIEAAVWCWKVKGGLSKRSNVLQERLRLKRVHLRRIFLVARISN